MILRKKNYATAAILGGSLLALFQYLGRPDNIAIISVIISALTLRLAAIYWRISLPDFQIIGKEKVNNNGTDAYVTTVLDVRLHP